MNSSSPIVNEARPTAAHSALQSIPFLDLVTPHLEMEEELVSAFRSCLRTASFVGGAPVADFESAFAEFCRAEHAIAVSSGTDALRFALIAAGVKPGCVVVTVPNTFIATTEAISQAGALPEFIDVDERTCNLSIGALETYLTMQCRPDAQGGLVSMRSGLPVRAIVPVHLYGQMADMDAVLNLARQFGLVVVEDACQAHGAEYFSAKQGRWMRAGSMGVAAAFSFYPGKNLGALGEAGAVTTNEAAVAQRVHLLRDHGQSRKYIHPVEGWNGRLDAIQCAFLSVKLRHLERWNSQRRDRAAEYKRLLSDIAMLRLPSEPEWSRSVWHLFVMHVQNRDALLEHLKRAGIGTGLHYPIPLHLQMAYANRGYREGAFPIAEQAAREILSLPMYPHLSSAEQKCVVSAIRSFTALRR